MSLDEHFALIVAEHQGSLRAPLSLRKALLVAVLLDHFADRVFAQWRGQPERVFGAADLPEFRAALAARSEALGTVFAIGSGRTALQVIAVEVPIADYPQLGVEDFMVSLYNQNSVQRVVVAQDGASGLAHGVLAAALAYWADADWR